MDQQFMLDIENKAKQWLGEGYDQATKKRVQYLIENDPALLVDAFYKDLEFGTGGLRGKMDVGSNRMNKYTVGLATQGLANYLKKTVKGRQAKVVIAYDTRKNSPFFARIAADVLSASGIYVYLFEDFRPLPELSFAVRYLKCSCGIIITASHNPKEYNGYKVFWEDGGQIISPHDKNITREIQKLRIVDVHFDGHEKKIEMVGERIDRAYLKSVKTLSLSKDLIKKYQDLKIVYSPIHGTGKYLVPQVLNQLGFKNVFHVPEQETTDGNFSTVKSPNPEEETTFKRAIKKAKEVDADIIVVTDPDADRAALAVREKKDRYIVLNGNQAATVLVYYLLNRMSEKKYLRGKEYVVKTIVTTEILKHIAKDRSVKCHDVLIGFKWIGDVIKRSTPEKKFLAGAEESIGFLAGDFVRDKDGVITCALFAEAAAWAAGQGKSLLDLLINIYVEYGYYKTRMVYVVKDGLAGEQEIKNMMDAYRRLRSGTIGGGKITKINDYLERKSIDIVTGVGKRITLPKSNIIQFFLEDRSKITVRPSGTEPKIKYYFEVSCDLPNAASFKKVDGILTERIDQLEKAIINII
jgi:phosphoglucomutase